MEICHSILWKLNFFLQVQKQLVKYFEGYLINKTLSRSQKILELQMARGRQNKFEEISLCVYPVFSCP